MGKVVVVDHPLVQHKLSLMRDKNCGTKDFRQLLEEIGMLMAYEVTRDLPLKEIEIETPVAPCKTHVLAGKKLGIVPILRSKLPNALISVYTYKSLVGGTGIADPSGRTTRYGYDSFNRLSEIRDDKGKNGNLMQKFEYKMTSNN